MLELVPQFPELDPPLVVVAEPDDDLREEYALFLGTAGMRTVQASDGLSALSLTLRYHPDLLVADLTLPGLTGTALAGVIKAEELDVQVLCTGVDRGSEAEVQAAGYGAVAVSNRPSPQELLSRVRDILAHSANLRERSERLRERTRMLRESGDSTIHRAMILYQKYAALREEHAARRRRTE